MDRVIDEHSRDAAGLDRNLFRPARDGARAAPPLATAMLPLWQHLAPITLDGARLARNHILLNTGLDAASSALDMMRTKSAITLRDNKWITLAIASPTRGCGATTVAANLALGLARQPDTRVLLMDLNLRRPRLAALFGIEARYNIETLLNGTNTLQRGLVRYRHNLAIAPNSLPIGCSSELLQARSTRAIFDDLRDQLAPNVIILDLPPMLESDDLLVSLPLLDCVMLVAGAGISSLGEIDICERELVARTNLLGVVLNQCRHGLEKFRS